VLKISRRWLQDYLRSLYRQIPGDLNFQLPRNAEIELFLLEADEIWSFVDRKENKRWVWLIMERRTRQIIAVHIGDRSKQNAKALWRKVSPEVKANAHWF
jgi:insertion element IS1 protein InsB